MPILKKDIQINEYPLNLESAATYLPGRLPSEYCRRWKSLRPCSGWERVVSFLFATDKTLFYALSCAEDCIVNLFVLITIAPVKFTNVNFYVALVRFRSVRRCSTHRRHELTHLMLQFARQVQSTKARFIVVFRKSPRPISNARLRLLPNFYLHPINVVFCDGTY